MKDGPHIARIATLIGDATRAEVLTALMADRALTATELAAVAGVTRATMSSHLARLVEAGLVGMCRQGRHRYFRLADPDVARLLESLMGVAFRTGAVRARSSPREPALRRARACYDHLAGELAVGLFDAMQAQAAIVVDGDEVQSGRRGASPLASGATAGSVGAVVNSPGVVGGVPDCATRPASHALSVIARG